MESNNKVLIVTDFTGNLHIVPIGNKAYYQARNQVNKNLQYKFKEGLTEEEALNFVKENNGIDPTFTTPATASDVIANKDKQLADKVSENEQLKKQLEELQAKLDNSNKLTAADVIIKITEAKSEEEVNTLIVGETRKTVLDAAAKKIAELKAA
jgi:hypothetical protein